jgi:hypothetical protein
VRARSISDSSPDGSIGSRSTSVSGGDLLAAYEADVARSRLRNVVVTDTLPLNVSQFAALFVEDNAPYGWKRYGWQPVSASLYYYSQIILLSLIVAKLVHSFHSLNINNNSFVSSYCFPIYTIDLSREATMRV